MSCVKLVVGAIAAIVSAGAISGCAGARHSPSVTSSSHPYAPYWHAIEDVRADIKAWEKVAGAAYVRDCYALKSVEHVTMPRIVVVPDAAGASYDAASATITIRPGESSAVLAHELFHHYSMQSGMTQRCLWEFSAWLYQENRKLRRELSRETVETKQLRREVRRERGKRLRRR